MDQDSTHRDNSFWVGLFLGGLVGALVIVVLGTEKGKKLLKNLEEKGLDFLEDTSDTVEEKLEVLQEKGQDLVGQSREVGAQVIQKVEEVKDDVTQTAVAQADATLAHIEALQERGRQSTAELRKKLFKNIPKKTVG